MNVIRSLISASMLLRIF